ncbi:unnamed protein product [Taenia asiatica]|uniref:Transmembrane protein n=1 Tax=Taenia asiatica TaxID=60517 RepID=A0A0R3W0S4_TAEAS|nr:unnamed protein product [Taenia asiatica]
MVQSNLSISRYAETRLQVLGPADTANPIDLLQWNEFHVRNLYLTVHDYVHPMFKYGTAQLVFNWVLSMQSIGMMCVTFGFLLVLLRLSGRVELEWFQKILLILLSIAAGALLFAAAIDLIYHTDFPYALTYTGTIIAVATAVSTEVNLFKIL